MIVHEGLAIFLKQKVRKSLTTAIVPNIVRNSSEIVSNPNLARRYTWNGTKVRRR